MRRGRAGKSVYPRAVGCEPACSSVLRSLVHAKLNTQDGERITIEGFAAAKEVLYDRLRALVANWASARIDALGLGASIISGVRREPHTPSISQRGLDWPSHHSQHLLRSMQDKLHGHDQDTRPVSRGQFTKAVRDALRAYHDPVRL